MKLKYLLGISLAFILLQASTAFAADPNLTTKDQKLSYALGASIGTSFHKQSISVHPQIFQRGLEDGLKGKKLLMSEDEIRQTLTTFQKQQFEKARVELTKAAEKNKTASQAFLKKFAKGAGVKESDGVYYKVIKPGKGPKPKATDTVVVKYRGFLPTENNKVFDSTYKRGQPAELTVKGVIPGFARVLQMMPVGSTWEVVIPPKLAYGDRGAGAAIGPNQVLKFEIKLLSIKKQKEKK